MPYIPDKLHVMTWSWKRLEKPYKYIMQKIGKYEYFTINDNTLHLHHVTRLPPTFSVKQTNPPDEFCIVLRTNLDQKLQRKQLHYYYKMYPNTSTKLSIWFTLQTVKTWQKQKTIIFIYLRHTDIQENEKDKFTTIADIRSKIQNQRYLRLYNEHHNFSVTTLYTEISVCPQSWNTQRQYMFHTLTSRQHT